MRIQPALPFVVFFVVALFVPTLSSACSCYHVPPEQAFEQSSAVFTGRVVGVTEVQQDGYPLYAVVFQWHAYWKGELNGQVVVFTSTSSAACGYSFEVGVTYLVYAYGDHSVYSTDLCTRTSPMYEGLIEREGLGDPKVVGVASKSWDGVKKLFR